MNFHFPHYLLPLNRINGINPVWYAPTIIRKCGLRDSVMMIFPDFYTCRETFYYRLRVVLGICFIFA
jgi:hypothetical protein